MKNSALKKIALMIIFLLSTTFVLTGCTLFQKDMEKYYNTIVATIQYEDGHKIEINKRELITAFNNYGASLVQNSGYTLEKAIDATMNALVNQKVLLEASKGKITFDNADKNKLWKDSLQAILNNVEAYAEQVRTEWEIEKPKTEAGEEDKKVVYTPFEPVVTLEFENGQYVIKVVQENNNEEELLVADMADVENKTLITNNLYNAVMQKTQFDKTGDLTDLEKLQRQEARVAAEAIKRYTKNLLTAEKGLKLSTDNQSVFKREIEKIYTNALTNAKVTKMQKLIARDTTYSTFTVQDVLNKYKQMLLESVQKYSVNPSALENDMLNNFEAVNYYNGEDYFFVSHILLKFSDQQKAEYESLKSDLAKNLISASYYNQRVEQLINQIVAVERDAEGNVIENSAKTSGQVLTEVQNALASATTKEQKAQAFRNLLYKYNQDDGALNSEYLYVIGTKNSQMVETFTNAARELYNNGNGVFGSISNLVPSEYGVHIVFYAGPVNQVFPITVNSVDNVVLTTEDIQILNTTLLNPLNNKTLFDKVYASLTEQSASANELMYLNNLKKDLTITKYVSRYKDLLA